MKRNSSWRYIHFGCFQKIGNTPKWMVYNRKPYLKWMIWVEKPLFSEASIFHWTMTSWWFQPIWKICSSKWDHFPRVRGENKKCLSCHHLDDYGRKGQMEISILQTWLASLPSTSGLAQLLGAQKIPPSRIHEENDRFPLPFLWLILMR